MYLGPNYNTREGGGSGYKQGLQKINQEIGFSRFKIFIQTKSRFSLRFSKVEKRQQYVQAVIIMSVALVVYCNMHKRTEPCPG